MRLTMLLVSRLFPSISVSRTVTVPLDIEFFHLHFSNDYAKIKRKMLFYEKAHSTYRMKYYILYNVTQLDNLILCVYIHLSRYTRTHAHTLTEKEEQADAALRVKKGFHVYVDEKLY